MVTEKGKSFGIIFKKKVFFRLFHRKMAIEAKRFQIENQKNFPKSLGKKSYSHQWIIIIGCRMDFDVRFSNMLNYCCTIGQNYRFDEWGIGRNRSSTKYK